MTQSSTRLDRFLAAVPVLVAGLVLLTILLWEASAMKAPFIFGDELKWALLSRRIAHDSHVASLQSSASSLSPYALLIAPWWRLASTNTAYAGIRYADTIVMALTAVPTYLLARRLVSPRWAAVAALGTLCTSALFYAPLLLPEVLAFPVFALFAYVAIEALAGRGRIWIVAAVVLAFVAILVRTQLAMAGGALVIAAAWLWLVGPRGKRLRSGWSPADHVGATLLAIGVFVVLNRIASPHVTQWSLVTQGLQSRMWNLGLEAGSALAIGLGVLPAIGGLASLWVPERRDDPQWRAFAAFLGASIVTFWTYTGVKAAYNSTIVFTRVEERNLIYLSPLLLVGTVIVFSARRRAWLSLVVAAAVVGYLVLHYGYQLAFPYSDAPGYGIAVMANRSFYWSQADIRWALAVAFAIALIVLAVVQERRIRPVVRRGVVALAVLTVGVWMVAGQVTSARGAQSAARAEVGGLAAIGAEPLNWVDRATHGDGVAYVGQELAPPLGDPTGLWQEEFWNRSIEIVDTLDSSSPGPALSITPGLAKPDGSLTDDPGLPYVLADGGVSFQATKMAQHGSLVLYRLASHPWKLEHSVIGLTGDGWIISSTRGAPAQGTYAYYGPQRSVGTLSVQIGSTLCPTGAPVQYATVRVGPVGLNNQQKPIVAQVMHTKRIVVPTCHDPRRRAAVLTFAVRPPVAVTVQVSPTVQPSAYGGSSDARLLGAQVGYSWRP
ncbi:MAG TPA: glycosyltransferase family 39 protein [Gaiellaceae bacterium]|nr:glycosyltransferase family 39 protein [Gaiellaceae bacterium]